MLKLDDVKQHHTESACSWLCFAPVRETEFFREEGRQGGYGVWRPAQGAPVVLGSRFDAADAARRAISAALIHPQQALVVVSPGLSGLAQEAARQRPGSVLLVDAHATPRGWFFDQHPGGLSGAEFLFHPSKEELLQWCLMHLAPGAPPPAVVWVNPALVRHPAYAALEEGLVQALRLTASEAGTLRQAGRFFLQNLLDNLPHLKTAGSLAPWQNCWRGKPLLLCGAGPSLEQAAPLLRERPDLPVLAVDMAWFALKKMGRTPHAMVTVAPYIVNLLKIHPDTTAHTALLFSAFSCPGVVRRFVGPKYAFLSYHSFREALGLAHTPALSGGGAVGSHLIHLGLLTGADPLILAGLDFALPGERAYAPGNPFFEEQSKQESAQLRVTGMTGEDLPTLPGYFAALQAIESFLVRWPALPSILNLGRGAKLTGAVMAEAADLAASLPPVPPFELPAPDVQQVLWERVEKKAQDMLRPILESLEKSSDPSDEVCQLIDACPILHEGLGQATAELAGDASQSWPAMVDYVKEVGGQLGLL